MAKIEILISEYRPLILVCTEARVTADVTDAELNVHGYRIIRSDANSRHSGGVVVYHRDDLKMVTLANHVRGYDNVVVFDCLSACCHGIWAGVYHSPAASHAEFLNDFESIIEPFLSLSKPITVTGDFNINVHASQTNTYKQRLRRFQFTHSFKQIITDFTRVTDISRTTVDLVFTNNHLISAAVSKNNEIADHKMLIITKRNQQREHHLKSIIDRSKLKAPDYEALLSAKLENAHISVSDVNDSAAQITRLIDESACELVTDKTIDLSYSRRWFNEELKLLREQRNQAERLAEFTNDPQHWCEYRSKRNLYNRTLKANKNHDLLSIITNCDGDQKKMWRYLKTFIDDRQAPPACIMFGDQRLSDPKLIADRLNEFFINSIVDIKRSIPYRAYASDITDREITQWNEFELVNAAMVHRVISNFKSKSGINNVNKDVLKMALNICSEQLVNLINDSFVYGIFPDCWKYTIVCPIPKVKGTDRPEELRPVNNCHPIDKTIQTLAKQQLEEHLKQNNLISECQSAYREKHSCETAINFVLTSWIQKREMKKKILAVFLDLSRAFETVDREILIDILQLNGIGGNVLAWFKSWLTGRKQFTKFEEQLSEPRDINDGIPQGTPLSAILFTLYINLIVECVRHCHIKLFADDCLIWIDVDNLNEAVVKIIEDLTNISRLLQELRLKLNPSKSKFMVIGDTTDTLDIDLSVDGQTIERVKKIKYLGVVIDDRLTFKDHCDYVVKKMSKKVNYLRRIRNRLDTKSALLLYNSLAVPHIDFCSSILFMLNDGDIRTIQLIQNRALRIVLNRPRDSSATAMHQDTSFLTVRQRITYNILLLMYKATNGLLPQYISSQLAYVSDVQPYALRSNNNLRLPALLTNTGQRSFLYRGAKLFNDMKSSGVTPDTNIRTFKEQLKTYVMQEFQ